MTSLTPNPSAEKPKKSKKKIIGIIAGVIIVLGIIGSCQEDSTPDNTAADETTTVEETTVEKTHAEETTVEEETTEAEEDTDPTQEETDAWVNDAVMGSSYEPYVVGTEWRFGNLWVNMQLNRETDKDIAESTAKLLANTAKFQGDDNPISADVSYIIVANAVGEQMAQEKVN